MKLYKSEWRVVVKDVAGNDDQDKILRGTIGRTADSTAFLMSFFCLTGHVMIPYSCTAPLSVQAGPLQPTVDHIGKGLDSLVAEMGAQKPEEREYYRREWKSHFANAIDALAGFPSQEPATRIRMAVEDFEYFLNSPGTCRKSAEHGLCHVGNSFLIAIELLHPRLQCG
jgi:hypothetical protein